MESSFYKQLFLYGLGVAVLLLLVQYLDYGLFVRRIPFEMYVGIVALIFTTVGVWMGLKLTRPKMAIEPALSKSLASVANENVSDLLSAHSISTREYEVLQLIALGHSNQEIADQLFISISTVKSHTSKLFEKLEAKRRTQAIQKGKELGLLY